MSDESSVWYSVDREQPLPDWVKNARKPWCFGLRWWAFLHSLCLAFGEFPTTGERQSFLDLAHRVIQHIPCMSCRRHATEYMQAHPPDMHNQRTFFTWAWRFHNAVNERLGKEYVPFDEALRIAASALIPQPMIYAENVPHDTITQLSKKDSTPLAAERVTGPGSDHKLSKHHHALLGGEGGGSNGGVVEQHHASMLNHDAKAIISQPRGFFDRDWGVIEWMLVGFALFGALSLVVCVLIPLLRTRSRVQDNDVVLPGISAVRGGRAGSADGGDLIRARSISTGRHTPMDIVAHHAPYTTRSILSY